MRRLMLLVICIFLLSGCGYTQKYLDNAVNEAYEQGYIDGSKDSEVLLEDDAAEELYSYGYEDGYRDCSQSIPGILQDFYDEAEYYAASESDWSVYEAWNNVQMYLDNPELIPEEDFLSSTKTLAIFSQYLDEYDFSK